MLMPHVVMMVCRAPGRRSRASQRLVVAQIPEWLELLVSQLVLSENNTMSVTFLLNPGASTACVAEALLEAIAVSPAQLIGTSPL